MSIEFVDPKGNPVVIRRPDLIIALRSYIREDRSTGEVRTHTIAIFENREAVFIASDPRTVEAAIVEHGAAFTRKLASRSWPQWIDPVIAPMPSSCINL